MPRERTIVFIDNSNVFHGSKSAGWRIDIRKLHDFLERDGEIWQTFFFASVTDPPRYQQTAFYNFIKHEMRYEVHLFQLGEKTICCRQCRSRHRVFVEKGVDVALANKLLTFANNRAFDTAILIAADKDFLDTIKAVKSNGLRVEIAAWQGTISQEMEAESSIPVIYFDDIRDDIELELAPDIEAEKLTSGEDEEDK